MGGKKRTFVLIVLALGICGFFGADWFVQQQIDNGLTEMNRKLAKFDSTFSYDSSHVGVLGSELVLKNVVISCNGFASTKIDRIVYENPLEMDRKCVVRMYGVSSEPFEMEALPLEEADLPQRVSGQDFWAGLEAGREYGRMIASKGKSDIVLEYEYRMETGDLNIIRCDGTSELGDSHFSCSLTGFFMDRFESDPMRAMECVAVKGMELKFQDKSIFALSRDFAIRAASNNEKISEADAEAKLSSMIDEVIDAGQSVLPQQLHSYLPPLNAFLHNPRAIGIKVEPQTPQYVFNKEHMRENSRSVLKALNICVMLNPSYNSQGAVIRMNDFLDLMPNYGGTLPAL